VFIIFDRTRALVMGKTKNYHTHQAHFTLDFVILARMSTAKNKQVTDRSSAN